ncbi:hypothetical protein FNW02_33190 [Komarekiella sp. 'clone 1']|uniref:Uncharacterized protein n=1 Tax=Komarekiella delphini-convector SJRDD-AB1 TaxID=2593771 RepID=A0AA40VV77_9NOST|nr:hypothetical protein [Komarekiella delphini-convector]MBD6620506.1 hypothetical protein [Komarekiella delphini-convector SJRDD-AB1]
MMTGLDGFKHTNSISVRCQMGSIVLYFWSILEDCSDRRTRKNEKGVVASPKELEFLKALWLRFYTLPKWDVIVVP